MIVFQHIQVCLYLSSKNIPLSTNACKHTINVCYHAEKQSHSQSDTSQMVLHGGAKLKPDNPDFTSPSVFTRSQNLCVTFCVHDTERKFRYILNEILLKIFKLISPIFPKNPNPAGEKNPTVSLHYSAVSQLYAATKINIPSDLSDLPSLSTREDGGAMAAPPMPETETKTDQTIRQVGFTFCFTFKITSVINL